MQGKVGLEEHFGIRRHYQRFQGILAERDICPESRRARLLDFHDKRLAEMDKHGMAIMILPPRAGRAGNPRPSERTKVARKANDLLAEQVRKRPGPFPCGTRCAADAGS